MAASYTGVFECRTVDQLHDQLIRGDVGSIARKCIIETLARSSKVAIEFGRVITKDFVESFLDGVQTDEEWDTMRELSLLVCVTYVDPSRPEMDNVYSHSHAVWLEELRALRLRWTHLKETDEGSANSTLTKIMGKFHKIQMLLCLDSR